MEQKENRVVLRGTVAGEAVLSHQVHGIDFYRFPLRGGDWGDSLL